MNKASVYFHFVLTKQATLFNESLGSVKPTPTYLHIIESYMGRIGARNLILLYDASQLAYPVHKTDDGYICTGLAPFTPPSGPDAWSVIYAYPPQRPASSALVKALVSVIQSHATSYDQVHTQHEQKSKTVTHSYFFLGVESRVHMVVVVPERRFGGHSIVTDFMQFFAQQLRLTWVFQSLGSGGKKSRRSGSRK